MKTKEELVQLEESLKLQHKPLYTITIPTDEDEVDFRTIFLKRFDRQTLNVIQKMAKNPATEPFKIVEVFLRATYVGGDDLQEIMDDIYMLRSVDAIIMDLVAVKSASVKKN